MLSVCTWNPSCFKVAVATATVSFTTFGTGMAPPEMYSVIPTLGG